jgi:hypothetical protein
MRQRSKHHILSLDRHFFDPVNRFASRQAFGALARCV